MQKISPFLWFDHRAEEAVSFYTSLFHDARITKTLRYPENSTVGTPGSVMAIGFELEGQEFLALNGGPEPGSRSTRSISFYVHCEDQAEIDGLWGPLLEGGRRSSAAGRPTGSASPGRSCRPVWTRCSPIPIRRRSSGSPTRS